MLETYNQRHGKPKKNSEFQHRNEEVHL